MLNQKNSHYYDGLMIWSSFAQAARVKDLQISLVCEVTS